MRLLSSGDRTRLVMEINFLKRWSAPFTEGTQACSRSGPVLKTGLRAPEEAEVSVNLLVDFRHALVWQKGDGSLLTTARRANAQAMGAQSPGSQITAAFSTVHLLNLKTTSKCHAGLHPFGAPHDLMVHFQIISIRGW